jgi:mannose-6-phosphate isomerase-like protein (cupin superfamily)
MSNVHQLPAARPFVLNREDGERIWFTNAAMTIKATAATTAGDLCLIETTAPIGHGPPLHVHHDEHEAFYVLEGSLEVVCGGERYEAGVGAFAFLPSGIAHTFRATGEGVTRVLTIAMPAGIEHFFREAGRPAEGSGLPPAAALDVEMVKSVATRHRIEFVGPPLGRS